MCPGGTLTGGGVRGAGEGYAAAAWCGAHCFMPPGGGLSSSHRPWLAAVKTANAAAYGKVLASRKVKVWAYGQS